MNNACEFQNKNPCMCETKTSEKQMQIYKPTKSYKMFPKL